MPLDEFAEELSEVIDERPTQGPTKLKFWGGVQGLAGRLQTDLQNGLSQPEIDASFEERKTKYGVNRFPSRPPKGFFELFFDALGDKTLIILMVSAVVSIVLGVFVEGESHGWIEGTAIIAAVLLVASVTAGNDYSKEKQFRKLSEVSDNKQIKVIRAGNQTLVSIFDILVGDIVILEAGDKVCSDGLLFEVDDLKADESSMTGEGEPVKKSLAHDPWMLCGCEVIEGRGKMMVVAVGSLSMWGKIKALIDKESSATPLQTHLEELAETIGKMGLVAAGFTFLTLVIQWLLRKQKDPEFVISDLGELVEYLITAITIVVVAVPEGLPLAVTLSLAYSMFKMMKDNNLVRHLEACETMGGATNICSDKTGTLTENKMTVVKSWIATKDHTGPIEGVDKFVIARLTEGIAANSTAYIVKNDGSPTEYVGNKTECALLEYIEAMKFNYVNLRKALPLKKMFPFNSTKKRMASILEKNDSGKLVIHVKGASEMVLELCSHALDQSGKQIPISQVKEKANSVINEMASHALRTIALAYAEVPEQEDWDQAPDGSLTLIGICGIKDPVRNEVPAAVKSCQEAGITVRMLTGDNIITAQQIARECGILTNDGIAIEGPNFRKLTDQEMDKILPRLQVMARSSPQDKYKLVSRLRELGEVVAVTGDGTNDAPQLKEADVGFSMGIAGTEVAKEASDIILLDDNFSSIVKAVQWGRNVFDSIRKFVQFQLTVNIVAVMIAFVGAVATGESPLKPVQMLWVNLIMDTLAALSLATESPTPELLKRKPYGRYEGIITPAMWRNIIGQATFQIVMLFGLLYQAQNIPQLGLPSELLSWTTKDHIVHTTIVFNTFVLCQLFNEINARKLGNEFNVLKGLFSNSIFIGIMIFTITVQYLIVQYGGEFTSTAPLTRTQWLACIAIASFTLPWGAFLRLIPVPTSGSQIYEELPSEGPVQIREAKQTNLTFRSAGQNVIRTNSVLKGLRRRTSVNRF